MEQWRREYNTFRPHSALGYQPPAPETKTAAAVPTVPKPHTGPGEDLITEPDYEALVEQIFTPDPEAVPEPAADENGTHSGVRFAANWLPTDSFQSCRSQRESTTVS